MSMFFFTVPTRHNALAYKHGRLVTTLPAGRHLRTWGATYVLTDLREQVQAISPQDIPTADGMVVKVSAAVRYSVVDATRFHEVTTDPVGTVYLATQVALRELLAEVTTEQIVQRGAKTPVGDLTGAVALAGEHVGIAVHEVVVKDVILPIELRAAAAELVTAKHRGQIQLEAARAETAALRSLANGAKLLDQHPAMAQLRMIQALPPGARVVLQVGAPEDAPADAADER